MEIKNVIYYKRVKELEKFIASEIIKNNKISMGLLVASILCKKEYIREQALDNNYLSTRAKEECFGRSIWYYLAQSGNYNQLIQAIEEKRFDPKIKDYFEASLWHYLAKSGNYQGLIQAIEENRFDPNIKNIYGESVWHYLAYSGNYQALIQAIEEKRFVEKMINYAGCITIWGCLKSSTISNEKLVEVLLIHAPREVPRYMKDLVNSVKKSLNRRTFFSIINIHLPTDIISVIYKYQKI